MAHVDQNADLGKDIFLPGSVIGNTSEFGSEFPGSSPGRATTTEGDTLYNFLMGNNLELRCTFAKGSRRGVLNCNYLGYNRL